jgi:serine/threonine-protein kinase RIM15
VRCGQVLSGRDVSYGVDWWALGVILFEFLTGLPPFHAQKRSETFSNILNRRLKFPKPMVIPPRFRDLIDQLLTVNAKLRLGSPGRNGVQSVMQARPAARTRTHTRSEIA